MTTDELFHTEDWSTIYHSLLYYLMHSGDCRIPDNMNLSEAEKNNISQHTGHVLALTKYVEAKSLERETEKRINDAGRDIFTRSWR